MNDIITILFTIIVGFISAILFRFMSLGFSFKQAIKRTILFPIESTYIHYKIYSVIKKDNKSLAFKLLLLPITDMPGVMVSIAEMHLNAKAKIEAIKELLNETQGEERRKLINHLKKEGIIVKKKVRIKSESEEKILTNQRIHYISVLIKNFEKYKNNFNSNFRDPFIKRA